MKILNAVAIFLVLINCGTGKNIAFDHVDDSVSYLNTNERYVLNRKLKLIYDTKYTSIKIYVVKKNKNSKYHASINGLPPDITIIIGKEIFEINVRNNYSGTFSNIDFIRLSTIKKEISESYYQFLIKLINIINSQALY